MRKSAGRARRAWFCSVDGCGRPHHAKGLCGAHYEAEARKGRRAMSEEWRPTDNRHRNCGGVLWARWYQRSTLLYCEKCERKGYAAV